MENEIKELFNVSEEDMNVVKDFNPTLKIELNHVYKLRINCEKPRQVEFKVVEKGKEITKTSPVIEVENLETDELCDLWISAWTLRTRIAKLYVKYNNSLKDIYIQVTKKEVEHEQWGLTNMYNVKDITENVARDINTGEKVIGEADISEEITEK